MGLDMYLERETYVGANYDHRNVTGNLHIDVDGEVLPIQFKRVNRIIEAVAYWRKANAIHAWFVSHVQGGVDECQRSYVPVEKLQKLLELVQKCLYTPENAGAILPTQSGFFFGSTYYDEWYFEDLKETEKMLTSILAEDNSHASFYYQSSW